MQIYLKYFLIYKNKKPMNLDNLYNQHKERLYKNFVAVGNPTLYGTNIPANLRHLWGETSDIIAWGDSTIMMAYYIGMLATEYHLNNNTDTLDKLKKALLSLDRLDGVAENSFDPTLPKDLYNGFFIRDDVYQNTLELFPYLKNDGIKKVASDSTPFDFGDGKDATRNKEMSQDQYWHLLIGLALVIKLVDNIYCVQLAENFTYRVTKRISNNKWWIINPVLNKKVIRGADVRYLSYGFCKASNYINNKLNKNTLSHYNSLYKFVFIVSPLLCRLSREAESVINDNLVVLSKKIRAWAETQTWQKVTDLYLKLWALPATIKS
jgi:hypothetical protein